MTATWTGPAGAASSPVAPERPGDAAAAAAAAGPPRLLIVDDSAPVGRALARIARTCGWEVDVAMTWGEARELLGAARYRLLLVDYGLGGEIDGAAAIVWTRRAYPGLAAVLMSGSPSCEEAAAAIACRLLVKPFGRDVLAALLDSAAGAAECSVQGAVHGEGKETPT